MAPYAFKLYRKVKCRIWNKRRRGDTELSVLVLHSAQKFVFLVDQTTAPRVSYKVLYSKLKST